MAAIDGSSLLMMEAVAILTDWRLVKTFECEAVLQEDLELGEQLFHVRAEPRHSSYIVTDRATGRQSSYDDRTGLVNTAGFVKRRQAHDLVFEPSPARLAFPLTLPIWGRRRDAYRMVDATESNGQLNVRLAASSDGSVAGELAIDLGLRVAVRIDAPTLHLEYRGIVPARSQFDQFGD